MSTKTEQCHLDSELTLRDRTASPLTVRVVELTLTKLHDQTIECRLTFYVNPQLYQRLDTEALFNLKPELRSPLSSGNFLPEPDIKLEITLQPNLLSCLTGHTANADETANYILNLSQEHPNDPLLLEENWLCLSVKQLTESGEIGYSTFWAYVTPSALDQGGTSSEQFSEAIVNFFQDWTQAYLPGMTQQATSGMVEGIANFFKELVDVSMNANSQEVETPQQNISTGGQIFAAIVNFCQQDEWPFSQIEGEPVLQIPFQGDNGKWTCYAKARIEQEQFAFYSVCPVNAPETKRQAIAEFITRANSGMIIGNFELDFADGTIHYKTSIDVKGSSLTSALIQQMVYTNVTMMDTYLPGIMSVIYGNVSPEEAIVGIEG